MQTQHLPASERDVGRAQGFGGKTGQAWAKAADKYEKFLLLFKLPKQVLNLSHPGSKEGIEIPLMERRYCHGLPKNETEHFPSS